VFPPIAEHRMPRCARSAWDRVRLDLTSRTVRFAEPGMEFDISAATARVYALEPAWARACDETA
jgi:hypothetical protein